MPVNIPLMKLNVPNPETKTSWVCPKLEPLFGDTEPAIQRC